MPAAHLKIRNKLTDTILTIFSLILKDDPVWSGALSALMASELMLQLGPGAGPAHRVGGGSFKGIKTSPTKQIQGYIIQTAELLINKFSLLPPKATYDPGFNTLCKDLFFCSLMFL